ncbi:sensor histidine kinase [Streptomyces sp. NPDC004726]
MKGWSGRSGLAKVDLYTRGTVYVLVWSGAVGLTLIMLTPPVRRDGPLILAVAGPLLGIAIGVVCSRLAHRAMDAYLGRGEVPRRLICWAVGLTAAATCTSLTIMSTLATADLQALSSMLLTGSLMPFLTVHSLLVRNRVTVVVQLIALGVVGGPVVLIADDIGWTLATLLFLAFINGWTAFAARASMWILAVLWELRRARDVQARLAVAEERLRFGRDLHDVLGRNLAVIALKSELAVQLARRGRPEAVDQMAEVQGIAQESQREVREVVRGYREADLRVELEGARGVLVAAGISCTVVVGELDLPGEVQSALGWVVREATTNVLRHGDARRCTISVATTDGSVVLVVENDRAGEGPAPAATGGSGLAGLRERLSAVDGTLEAGPARGGYFRLTARVGMPSRVSDGAGAEGAEADGAGAEGAGAVGAEDVDAGLEAGTEGAGTGLDAGTESAGAGPGAGQGHGRPIGAFTGIRAGAGAKAETGTEGTA